MNKQELIEAVKELPANCSGPRPLIDKLTTLELIKLLDESTSGHAEEAPRYVKNILARLRELPLHDREVWLKAIMSEFERDFSHAKWREGYEQGKFEGMFGCEKVTIPQFVAEIIEYYKGQNATLYDVLREKNFNKQYSEWLLNEQNAYDKVARAWLDGYEVEKEKRYRVKFIPTGQHLAKNIYPGGAYFIIKFSAISSIDSFTRTELEEEGFGWVFSCEGVEVEEVDE